MKRKRNSHSNSDPANLKRFRNEIMHMPESPSSQFSFQHSKSEFYSSKNNSRKKRRKEERNMKKARRLAYSQRKPMPNKDEESLKKKEQVLEVVKEKQTVKSQKKKQKMKEKKKARLQREAEARKEEMYLEIQKEQKMMKQLEKQLHLNKRKSKNLPQSFMDDGLDYLLDVVDKEKVSALYENSDEEEGLRKLGEESGSDQEISDEDEDVKKQTIEEIMSHLKKSSAKSILKSDKPGKGNEKKTKVKFEEDAASDDEDDHDDEDFEDEDDFTDENDDDLDKEDDNLEEESDSDDENVYDEDDIEQEDASSDTDEKDDSENEMRAEMSDEEIDNENSDDQDLLGKKMKDKINKSKQSLETNLKEDIYGRLRDSEGNVVTKATGSYVPPAKRIAMAGSLDEKQRLKIERLKKQIKGLINRATEANMGPITTQLETIYTTHSRGDVNESLCDIIMDSTITEILTPERLAMELMMMMAILNDNVGMEVGGLFIQQLAHRLRDSWEDTETKILDNVVLLFSHLYNFKVLHCVLIFDLIRKFVERFTEKDIELILLLLKCVGFSLRKDDPHTLKDIILLIQGKANSMEKTESTRVKFMLEVLLAIKNNNMRKIPNYDPEKFEELKKSARNYVKGSFGVNQLRIGLEDLMNAEDKGRWWVIGSAWEGRSGKQNEASESVKTTMLGGMSEKILELARKQRMNTETRKNIFCIIMTSEDFIDAFEKLLRLGLKNQQEREIIHVITDCCVQEKSYNPFYSFLLQKFCEYDRRFQMTFQFMLWDKFKEMGHQSEQSRHHLAKLVTHLLVTKAISLSVFKVIEFGTLDKNMVRFLKQVLQDILLDNPDQLIQDVFSRIAPLTKLHLLHEGLKLFMRHFIIGKKSKQDQKKILVDRVTMAEKALSKGEGSFEL